uniref:ShKT domain-containing protein n=1 Tax=Pyrodinium bahamense TaxID=73915 RepID=A0A7S0FJ26_9DINO|mmetsp:Transcript_33785/g.93499  ORF Transcript_33785/g.93499 Transcript_33785/m.93499 type:complete len:193 (+) Transcript_33785:92-670(+)
MRAASCWGCLSLTVLLFSLPLHVAASDPPAVSCACDPGAPACSTTDRQSNTTGYYLCDGSSKFEQCRREVATSQTCECLAMGPCNSTTVMLELNRKDCQDACHSPESLDDICPNYDDEVYWCSHSAIKQCILHTATCEYKPQMTSCEAGCDVKAQQQKHSDAQLDSLLQCLGTCEQDAVVQPLLAEPTPVVV